MSCLINRNNEGKIISVKTPQGEDSKLFQAINSNIFMGEADASVKILSAAYSMDNTFESYDTAEPKLYLKSSVGNEFEDLEEMLIADELGSTTMGFKNLETGEFTPIAKFDTEYSEKNIFLRDQVQQGILSADRVLQLDGVTRFQGKGEFDMTRKAMARAAKFEALMDLGNGRTKVNKDGTFEIEFPTNTVIAEYGNETKIIEIKDIPTEISKSNNKADLATQYVLAEMAKKGQTKTTQKPQDVKVLLDSLYSFLQSMGFTTTTLEEYRKNYNTKYGKDPDILAISDMANKVVALAQGVDVTQEMTEEVAHIALEAFAEQSSIVGAMASVHLTPEWTEHSEYYTNLYSKSLKGIELEDKVRKEILGKVLARQIRERFQSKDSPSLVGKLKDIFTKFLNSIQSIFRPHHMQSLDRLMNKIADSVLQEEYSTFDKAFESENYFYSAMASDNKKIENELQATKKALDSMFSSVLKTKNPQQSKLDRIAEEMEERDIISSINTIVGITKNQLEVIEAVVKEANQKGEIIDKVNANRFSYLSDYIFPLMNKIKMHLDARLEQGEVSESHKKTAVHLSEEIARLSGRKDSVEPKITVDNQEHVEKMHSDAIDEFELTDEQKEKYKQELRNAGRDTSWFGKMFGLMTQNSNQGLALAANIVSKMNIQINNIFKTSADKTVEEIYSSKLEKHQKGITKRVGGKPSYYYMSPINWTQYDADLKTAQVEILHSITGMSKEDILKKLEKNKPEELLTNAADIIKYREENKKWKDTDGVERRFKDKYYEDRDARYTKAKISDSTRAYIENKNVANFARNRKFFRLDGTIDKTSQLESEKIEDINAYQSHLSVKSAYDQLGIIREGLKRVSPQDLTNEQIEALHFDKEIKKYLIENKKKFTGEITILNEDFAIENLSEDARLALDLASLDLIYRKDFEDGVKGEPSQKFYDALENAGEDAFDFLAANTSMNISSKYYEALGSSVNFNDVAEMYIKTLPTDQGIVKRIVLNDLIELKKSRKELLKQFKKMRSPIDTDAYNMQSTTRDRIIELDDLISKRSKDLLLPAEYYEKMTKFNSSSGLNDDFYKMATESNLSFEDFCLKHMTKSNRGKYEDFSRDIVDYAKERKKTVKKQYANAVAKIYKDFDLETKLPEERIKVLRREFAKQNVASYFQRYEPVGYSTAMEALRNGDINPSDLFTNKEALVEQYPALEFMEFTPDYSWLEETLNEEYHNPNFKPGYYLQPKLDKYVDKEFFSHYGISMEDFNTHGHDLKSYTPTQNQEEFKLLVMMTTLRETSADLMNDKDTVNKYLRPQQSKDGIEQALSMIGSSTSKNIKEIFNDMTSDRIDDQIYGDRIEDADIDIKMIPKYFQQKLDDPSLLTDSVIQAALLDYKEALRYQERTKVERDLKALEMYMLKVQKVESHAGFKKKIMKKGEVSNYSEKLTEYIDYKLYGIKQSRKFIVNILGKERDLTQSINTIQGVMRFSNLAFNPLVDITSATTGIINNVIDRVAGDYYHKSSSSRANSVATTWMGSYIAETSQINKKSKMNHVMEFLLINNIDDRLQNTAFGRGTRFIDKSPYAMSKLANSPVTPKVALTILMDYRISDGKFRSWSDFYTHKKNENKDLKKTEIEAMWSAIKNESFYDHLDISASGIKYNQKFVEAFPEEYGKSKKSTRKQFEAIQAQVAQKAMHVIQNVDGVLNETDQVAAQRDVLTNTVMMHKGWLLISLSKRFKKQHLNLATGQVEEGHYVTLMNFLGGITKRKKTGESMKQVYDGLTENQKKSLKRVTVETAFGMFLLALGSLVIGADDDEDEYLENLFQVIYLRTVGEYNTAQFYAMHGSLVETFKSPIVAMKTIEDIIKIPGKFLGGEDGDGVKQLTKVTIAKRFNQIGSTDALQEQLNSYRHFNDLTLFNLASGKKQEE